MSFFRYGKQTGTTKADLAGHVAKLEDALAAVQQQHQTLLAQSIFWQNTAIDYANQIGFWQTKHLRLLEHISKTPEAEDFERYVNEVHAAIAKARPEPSALAAVLAMAGKLTQGVYTTAPREPASNGFSFLRPPPPQRVSGLTSDLPLDMDFVELVTPESLREKGGL